MVAVIHTHPGGMPAPSARDIAEAARVGVPFYVATRSSLCVAYSDKRVECSAKSRAKRSRVSAAADHRFAAALEMNAK
jgi:proteasome lid subunit RPN8/RPN11